MVFKIIFFGLLLIAIIFTLAEMAKNYKMYKQAKDKQEKQKKIKELGIIKHHIDIQRSPFSLKNIK